MVEYLGWRKQLMDVTRTEHALYPLLHFVLDDLPTSTRAPELDDRNTQQLLQGKQCPLLESLIKLYLVYLIQVKFLPASSKLESMVALREEMVALSRTAH